MGLISQLGKFSSRIAEISQPLRELLQKGHAWIWGPEQEKSFSEIKSELSKPIVLALYDPLANTKVSADTSSFVHKLAFGQGRTVTKMKQQTLVFTANGDIEFNRADTGHSAWPVFPT